MLTVKSYYAYTASHSLSVCHRHTRTRHFSHGVSGVCGASASVARRDSHAARNGHGGYGLAITLRVVAVVAVAQH